MEKKWWVEKKFDGLFWPTPCTKNRKFSPRKLTFWLVSYFCIGNSKKNVPTMICGPSSLKLGSFLLTMPLRIIFDGFFWPIILFLFFHFIILTIKIASLDIFLIIQLNTCKKFFVTLTYKVVYSKKKKKIKVTYWQVKQATFIYIFNINWLLLIYFLYT